MRAMLCENGVNAYPWYMVSSTSWIYCRYITSILYNNLLNLELQPFFDMHKIYNKQKVCGPTVWADLGWYHLQIYLHAFDPFPNKPWFLRVCSAWLLKTLWEKEKLLVTSNFSFAHSVFYPFGELCAIFIKFEIFVFKLFQFGRV